MPPTSAVFPRNPRRPPDARRGLALRFGLAVILVLGPSAGAWAQTPPGSRTFLIQNYGSQPITTLYGAPSADTSWGASLIAAPIPPSGSVQVTLPKSDCMYDFQAAYANAATTRLSNLDTCAFNSTAMAGPADGPAPQAPYRLTISNASAEPLTHVFARPAGAQDWGQSRLAAPLAQNGSQVVELPGCQYDLDVKYGSRDVVYTNQNICAFSTMAFVAPQAQPVAPAAAAEPPTGTGGPPAGADQPPAAGTPPPQAGAVPPSQFTASASSSYKDLLAAAYEVRAVTLIPAAEVQALGFPPGTAPLVFVSLQKGASSAVCGFSWQAWRTQIIEELARTDLCNAYPAAP